MLQNWKLKKAEPNSLEKEIERLFKIARECVPGTARYDEVTDQIAKLYKLQEVDSKKRVSPDALVGAATSLGSILFILNYEHAHVMTSKAIGFVMKNIR